MDCLIGPNASFSVLGDDIPPGWIGAFYIYSYYLAILWGRGLGMIGFPGLPAAVTAITSEKNFLRGLIRTQFSGTSQSGTNRVGPISFSNTRAALGLLQVRACFATMTL